MSNTGLKYYSLDKCYSYNAAFNFIIGARGLGKTYSTKVKAVSRAIKHGEQFIYLRRYKTELDARSKFIDDFVDEFPDYKFRVEGYNFEYAKASDNGKKVDWKIAGYFVALSTAQTKKSTPYPKVKTIIFDEFIIEKGALHYLNNEFVAMLNFYNTVDRWRDEVKVFFLANAVTMTNPYFLALDLKPDQMDEYTLIRNGFVFVHLATSTDFKSGVMATRFGQFIEGTEYADYAVGNEFHDANDTFIKFKSFDARYRWTIETETGTFSVWIDAMQNMYYLSGKRPKNEKIITLLPERARPGVTIAFNNDKLIQMLRTAFSTSRMYFDEPKTRNAFINLFKK